MPTTYRCKGCLKVFDAGEPVVLTTPHQPAVFYPRCPSAQLKLNELANDPNYTANTYDNFLAMQQQADLLRAAHPVGLAVEAPPPKLLGAWGAKTLVLKPPTAEEAKALEDQSELAAIEAERLKKDERADEDARQLITKMELAMNGGNGGKSANFPLDLQYGTTPNGGFVKSTAKVVKRAGELWAKKGDDYSFRSEKPKQVWGVTMANFERLIVSGDPDQGKHNFHVVVDK